MCHMSGVRCHVSCVRVGYSVEGLLSTGPTPSSFVKDFMREKKLQFVFIKNFTYHISHVMCHMSHII